MKLVSRRSSDRKIVRLETILPPVGDSTVQYLPKRQATRGFWATIINLLFHNRKSFTRALLLLFPFPDAPPPLLVALDPHVLLVPDEERLARPGGAVVVVAGGRAATAAHQRLQGGLGLEDDGPRDRRHGAAPGLPGPVT